MNAQEMLACATEAERKRCAKACEKIAQRARVHDSTDNEEVTFHVGEESAASDCAVTVRRGGQSQCVISCLLLYCAMGH